MAGSVYDNGDGPRAEINVTPLVDVMLVLLVIFMVTAPLLQQGVEVNLPKTSSAPLKGSTEQVVLSIDRAGAVFLGAGNKVELEQLPEKVKAVLATRPESERKIFIKGDTQLDYGRVMDVMGALHRGGVTQIGLISAPPSSEQRVSKPKVK